MPGDALAHKAIGHKRHFDAFAGGLAAENGGYGVVNDLDLSFIQSPVHVTWIPGFADICKDHLKRRGRALADEAG